MSAALRTRPEGTKPEGADSKRSRLVTLLLCWFLGPFGAHRLYVGRTMSGLSMTLIGAGSIACAVRAMLAAVAQGSSGARAIWVALSVFYLLVALQLVDLVRILIGSFTDVEGLRVFRWIDPGS